MFANNYISTIVENQLPDFIRADDAQKGASEPSFTKLLKKYYEFLEQEGNTVKVGKELYDYIDVETTRTDLLKYFKTKFIPNFPEESELSTEKVIKAARDFYAKKGTPESFQFLFRILYNQDASIYFPKEDILRASDGKWKLPQALRLSIAETSRYIPGGNVNVANITANIVSANGFNLAATAITANSYIRIGNERRQVQSINSYGDILTVNIPFANTTGNTLIYDSARLYRLIPNEYENFNFNLLERRLGIGEVSRTTCVIEKAVKTIDSSGREIVEIYVSNVTRLFDPGEYLLVDYVDENGVTQQFKSKIISSISNINLYRNRFGVVQTGQRYLPGDPVVLFGGLDPNSDEAEKAVAFVGDVSDGNMEGLTLVKDGYYFRSYANAYVRILSSSGIGGNVIIEGIWEDAGNSEVFSFSTDAIVYKKDIVLNEVNGYDFDNVSAYINLTSGAGNTTTTINLNTTNFIASSVNNYYNSSIIRVVDGTAATGFVNSATIIAYNGTTKIATLSNALDVPVDATSKLLMYANGNTTLQRAFSYDEIRLGKIRLLGLENGGLFYEEPPGFDAISVYDTDFVKDSQTLLNPQGFLIIPTTHFDDYNPTGSPYPSLTLNRSNNQYSTANGFYNNCRLFLDVGQTAHYREIVDYVVENIGSPTLETRTIYLDAPFESNIDDNNILNFQLYMDFRPNIRNLGKLGAIIINSGGSNYSPTDQIVFDGTGYGAAATLTINGGVITGVTITNRGEGYFESPSFRIVNSSGGTSTGSGAQLTILGLSDGEEIVAETDEIGKVLTFDIVNRGFDYAETPITSLKVADILTDNLSDQVIVFGGNTVWQGNTTNALSTFNGIVDELYRPDSTNTVIRIFNYNGRINVDAPLYIATGAGNVAVNVYNTNATISFNDIGIPVEKSYPLFYGNGRAKANAEFLRGLIKYDGFYLNTDGFLSSDKKLQNKDYYHNYSYEIESEKPLLTYKDTVKPIAHPAGMQMLARYLMRNELDRSMYISSNIHVTNTTLVTNVNTSYSSNVVYGNNSNFGITANAGDIIQINTTATEDFRKYSRVITFVDSANDILWLERPIGGLGDGRFLVNTGNANVIITQNTSAVTESLVVGDNVTFNVSNTVYDRYVVEISGARIKLNAAITNSGNSLYIKTPKYNVVFYEIISVNG